jgi:hypothetical protein
VASVRPLRLTVVRYEDANPLHRVMRWQAGKAPMSRLWARTLHHLDRLVFRPTKERHTFSTLASGLPVSNPDADHIGGFLDVFDAFPVETVYVSGDPNSTLTYNTFLRGVRDEGAKTEVLRAGMLMDWGGVRADV